MNILFLSLTPQDPAQDHFWRNRQTLLALASLDHTVDWIAPPLPPHLNLPLPDCVTLRALPPLWNTLAGLALMTAALPSRPELIHAVDTAFPSVPFLFPSVPLLADISATLPRRLGKADAIIAHSPLLFQHLRHHPAHARTALLTPLPFAQTPPLPTAVERARFHRLGDQNGILLACAASATPQTTLSLLLEALPEFSTLPAPCKLLILTQNQRELAATRRLLKKHPSSENITLVPPSTPDESQTLLAACDLLLAPSPCGEVAPSPCTSRLVCLQTPRLLDFAFSGTPILATDTEPHRHELPPDCAAFFPPTSRALLESLQRLFSNYDTALQRAARATEHLASLNPSLRVEELRLAYAYALR